MDITTCPLCGSTRIELRFTKVWKCLACLELFDRWDFVQEPTRRKGALKYRDPDDD